MKTNTDFTVYNKYIASKAEAYKRTSVLSVAWQAYDGSKKLSQGGQISEDKVIVYVPSANRSAYLKPIAWQALADKSANWTLQNADVIVKGTVTDEISVSFTITDLMAKYDDVFIVTNVKTLDYGPERGQHWKVLAK